ncbi:hypothetical protein VAA_04228 [Vibrio anguillarum 775]|nr:hypothetical protein VAA_04228 [Vibrio anguillarum 775]
MLLSAWYCKAIEKHKGLNSLNQPIWMNIYQMLEV